MGLPRSTFYDVRAARLDDAEIVGRMQRICDEFEAYGYRRVGAELRHQGIVVNHKKIRRLMRDYNLQPKRRRRYVATTNSNHDSPIFPDRARHRVIEGGSQTSPISRSRAASFIWQSSSTPGRAAWWAMPSAVQSTPDSRSPR